MSSLFDLYERKARLAPALLAGLPLALLFLWLGMTDWPWAIAGLVIEAGGAIPLAELARDRGKALQVELWAKWGQSPLASKLGDRGSASAAIARDYISRHYPRFTVADDGVATYPDAELAEAIGEILRHHVRGLPGHDVVSAENRSYGFQRNLLGLRPIGLTLSLGSVVAAMALALVLDLGGSGWLAVLAASSATVFWLLYPAEPRVRTAGERYAEAVVGLIAAHAAKMEGA